MSFTDIKRKQSVRAKQKKINVIANMITHCLDIYLCLAIRMVVELNITLIAAGVCEQAYTPADVTACHSEARNRNIKIK